MESPYVENVQITMAESFGVDGRGKFYEETGVIRDVIQNHLFQVLSLLAMEPPSSIGAEAIRDEQAKVLRTVGRRDPTWCSASIAATARSPTSPRFTGADLRRAAAACRLVALGGRAVLRPRRKVAGQDRDGSEGRVEAGTRSRVSGNIPASGQLRAVSTRPAGRDRVGALIKKPGERLVGKPVELSVVRQDTADDMDAYERLLGDAMHGDATLFARQDVSKRRGRSSTR